MSVADLKKYGKMIAEDTKVRAKAKQIGINDMEGQIKYASTLGLTFTTADMQALAREAGVDKEELSEEQLEKVAGGFFTTTVVTAVCAVGGLATSVGSQASRNW